jgi:hypothetical protein
MKEKLQIRFASHTYTPKIVSTVNCQKKLALIIPRLIDPYNQQCYLLPKGRGIMVMTDRQRKAMFASWGSGGNKDVSDETGLNKYGSHNSIIDHKSKLRMARKHLGLKLNVYDEPELEIVNYFKKNPEQVKIQEDKYNEFIQNPVNRHKKGWIKPNKQRLGNDLSFISTYGRNTKNDHFSNDAHVNAKRDVDRYGDNKHTIRYLQEKAKEHSIY